MTVRAGRSTKMRIRLQAQRRGPTLNGLRLCCMAVVTVAPCSLVTLVFCRVAGAAVERLVEAIQLELRVCVVDEEQIRPHEALLLMAVLAGMVHLSLMRILMAVLTALAQTCKTGLGQRGCTLGRLVAFCTGKILVFSL